MIFRNTLSCVFWACRCSPCLQLNSVRQHWYSASKIFTQSPSRFLPMPGSARQQHPYIIWGSSFGLLAHDEDRCSSKHNTPNISKSLRRSMSINIMPILPPQILPDLIVLLRSPQQSQIHINNPNPLLILHLHNRPHNRKRHLRQPHEVLRRTGGIDEDDAAGILETAGC